MVADELPGSGFVSGLFDRILADYVRRGKGYT
jgi:hypothetical protein